MSNASTWKQIVAANPEFAVRMVWFVQLKDAADILGELKAPQHETASAYLREVADHLMRDLGATDTILQMMNSARSSVTDLTYPEENDA